MRVVLGKGAYPREALYDARALIAMQPPEIGDAVGQIAVAMLIHRKDEAMRGAVHRLHAKTEMLNEEIGDGLFILGRVLKERAARILEPIDRRRDEHIFAIRR